MRIEADSVVPFSREKVFSAYRDDMKDFVKLLPNLRGIEQKERVDENGVTRLLNVWHGGGDIPAAVRGVMGDKALSWDDFALWKQAEWICEWNIKPHVLTEAVKCGGKTTFVELAGSRTRMEIRGDISIDLKKVRGVPSFLAGSIGRAVEQFLVRAITPNLTGVADALTKHLQSKG